MIIRLFSAVIAAFAAIAVNAQQWDTVIGDALEVGETGPHWFSVRGGETAFLINGDTGRVGGTLTLSSFSPAVRPHMDRGLIYTYGTFYSRNNYGDRLDLVIAGSRNVEVLSSRAGCANRSSTSPCHRDLGESSAVC